jgi:hypothetical protein
MTLVKTTKQLHRDISNGTEKKAQAPLDKNEVPAGSAFEFHQSRIWFEHHWTCCPHSDGDMC